jgi:putative oxidoreductase
MKSNGSSHPTLSCTDGIANSAGDILLLVARVLLVIVLFLFAWAGSPTAGYVGSLGVPSPGFWSSVAIAIEFIVSVSLALGLATRYGALLGILYVIVATALAHRYWEYPAPVQLAQYTNFTKNLAILGGLLLVFVTGAGAISIDRILSKRQKG